MDMQQLLAAAQQMQDQLMSAQRELADAEVEGTAGGGLVKARVNGQGDLVDLTISPAVIDAGDPAETAETVADLVLAAVRDAYRAAAELQQEKMGPLAAGLGGLGGGSGLPDMPGLPDLPGLPGFPGPGTVRAARQAAAEGSGPQVYEGVVQSLIDELGRLPGVGPKGAQRIAFYLLASDATDVRRLASILVEVTERVRFCRICGNVAEEEECRICRDPRRDQSVICVVEEPKDVATIEKIREFRGRYHVLGGAISPIDGIGPRICGPGNSWHGCRMAASPN